MLFKMCARCGTERPEEEFAFKDKARGIRGTRCRGCVREASREHYLANREAYIGRAKKSNAELIRKKRALVGQLRSRPCGDCGGTFPECCMQFDHRQGRGIRGRNSPEAIANLKQGTESFPKLVAELAKCDVLCANCHAIRTHDRREAGRTA